MRFLSGQARGVRGFLSHHPAALVSPGNPWLAKHSLTLVRTEYHAYSMTASLHSRQKGPSGGLRIETRNGTLDGLGLPGDRGPDRRVLRYLYVGHLSQGDPTVEFPASVQSAPERALAG
jgi:hypothetical protein